MIMNTVDIDASKMVILRPDGKLFAKPFVVSYLADELPSLMNLIHFLEAETHIVRGCTDRYYKPIAKNSKEGFFISTVNPHIICNFSRTG